jgi:hypothetical protein
MTREELKELLPNVSFPSGEKVSIEGGLPPKLTDIKKVEITFVANHVDRIRVVYKDKGWRNIDEFIDETFIKLNLPYAQGEPLESDTDSLKHTSIRCKDFTVFAGGGIFGELSRTFDVNLHSTVQK